VYKEQLNQPFPPDSGLDMAPRDVHCDVQRYIAKRPVAGAVLLDRIICGLQLGWPEEQHWCGYRFGLQSVQRVAPAGAGPMPPTDCPKLRKARDDRGSKCKAGTFCTEETKRRAASPSLAGRMPERGILR
jgi:hypothetical protein